MAVIETNEVLSWGGGESGRHGHGHKSSLLSLLSSNSEQRDSLTNLTSIKEDMMMVRSKNFVDSTINKAILEKVIGQTSVSLFVGLVKRRQWTIKIVQRVQYAIILSMDLIWGLFVVNLRLGILHIRMLKKVGYLQMRLHNMLHVSHKHYQAKSFVDQVRALEGTIGTIQNYLIEKNIFLPSDCLKMIIRVKVVMSLVI